MIFNGINCNMLYIPCPRCVMDFGIPDLDKGGVNETMLFCEGCIPNYENSGMLTNINSIHKLDHSSSVVCLIQL